MLTHERQREILKILLEKEFASVEYLCKTLYSSGATVRRDLAALENRGELKRVRGGAVSIGCSSADAPLLLRERRNIRQKQIIAALAQEYVCDCGVLFVDGSSTGCEFLRNRNNTRERTIITNGAAAINACIENENCRVIATGGELLDSSSFVGAAAVKSVGGYLADAAVISCRGISEDGIITEANEQIAAVKTAMLHNSARKILLCDSSKFCDGYYIKTASLDDIDLLITDSRPPQKLYGADCKIICPSSPPKPENLDEYHFV